jgi:hypothetical protein
MPPFNFSEYGTTRVLNSLLESSELHTLPSIDLRIVIISVFAHEFEVRYLTQIG